jgi:hypothetical protein
MTRTTPRRVAAATVAAAALVAAGALPSAARTDVNREELLYQGFFFDNVAVGTGDPDVILFADVSPAQMCAGTEVPFVERGRVSGVPPADGASENYSFVKRGPLELYDGGGLSAPDFVGAYCAALEGGSDVPEPIGIGEGLIQAEIQVEWSGDGAPPDVVQTDSVRGSVLTPGGERLVVRGDAEVVLAPVLELTYLSVQIRNG